MTMSPNLGSVRRGHRAFWCQIIAKSLAPFSLLCRNCDFCGVPKEFFEGGKNLSWSSCHNSERKKSFSVLQCRRAYIIVFFSVPIAFCVDCLFLVLVIMDANSLQLMRKLIARRKRDTAHEILVLETTYQ